MPQELKDLIQQNRPSLSQSSITTYHSILTNLHKKVFPDTEFYLPNLKQFQIVLNHLGDMPSNKRKTILASLVVVFPEHKEYKDLMMTDIQSYQKQIQEQEKTEIQRENWVNTDELDSTYSKLKRNGTMQSKKGNKEEMSWNRENLSWSAPSTSRCFRLISQSWKIFLTP